MSLSSISWHIGLLVGSSSPAPPITPSPKEWLALVGSTVGMHCRSEPHQECVPARSPRRGTPPTSTPAAGPEQLQPLQVIGGELDPSARLSATDYAPRACRAMGWVGAYGRVPWSPRSADVTTIRCPRPGDLKVERDWIVVCLITETSRDDLGVSGSMGRCPPDYDPAAGTGHHPTRMISRRPRPGRDLTVEGCGEPHPGRRT